MKQRIYNDFCKQTFESSTKLSDYCTPVPIRLNLLLLSFGVILTMFDFQ